MAFNQQQAQQYGLTRSTAPIPVRKPERSAISQLLPGVISNFTGSPAAGADFAGGGAALTLDEQREARKRNNL